jgi:cation diffusion facilitator CzcD-associated flavoprotein CzcO
MREYLEMYVEKFQIKKYIKFGYEIIRLEQTNGEKWELTTKSEKGIETFRFDKIVMANGRHQSPLWPDVSDLDKFQGELIHSST